MVKYFPDGLVRTLYVGAFVNGQFEDQSGNAWMIGKNKPEESYSYYKGPFKNGNPVKDIKYWQYNLTVEEINAILEKMDSRVTASLSGNTLLFEGAP